jgi:hypothetical protein
MSASKRLKALQGLWVESKDGGRGKKWLIEGKCAIQQEGQKGRQRFDLQFYDNDIYWGQGSKYVLDSTVSPGSSIITWYSTSGSKDFSWERLRDSTSSSAPSRQWKQEKQAGGDDAKEKRIDPADGKSYTLDELMTYYAKMFDTPKIQSTSYWMSCPKAGSSGKASRAEDLVRELKANRESLGQNDTWYPTWPLPPPKGAPKGSEPKPKAKAQASVQKVEKRIDPGDGKAYTLPEMRTFYSAKFTKKEVEAYWEDCWCSSL